MKELIFILLQGEIGNDIPVIYILQTLNKKKRNCIQHIHYEISVIVGYFQGEPHDSLLFENSDCI